MASFEHQRSSLKPVNRRAALPRQASMYNNEHRGIPSLRWEISLVSGRGGTIHAMPLSIEDVLLESVRWKGSSYQACEAGAAAVGPLRWQKGAAG